MKRMSSTLDFVFWSCVGRWRMRYELMAPLKWRRGVTSSFSNLGVWP